MSFLHRAFLYLVRKRMKNLTLFIIVLVIASLSLSALALKTAVGTAQLNIRKALGGSFSVTSSSNSGSALDELTAEIDDSQKSVTRAFAEAISEQLDGISGYNLSGRYYTRVQKQDGTPLSLVQNGGGSYDATLQYMSGHNMIETDLFVSFLQLSCSNSSLDSHFVKRNISLVEGRHIEESENNVAIISTELAKLNGIEIGDTLQLRPSDFLLKQTEAAPTVSVTIVGLFSVNEKGNNYFSYAAWENMFFTTDYTIKQIQVSPDPLWSSYNQVNFYANDPGDLQRMAEYTQDILKSERLDFAVAIDNAKVLSVTQPLVSMELLITLLLLLILVVGMAVLFLVLSARIKERIHETGILISTGVRKINVIGQYLIEITVITILACTAAILCSSLIAKTAGNALLDNTMDSITELQQSVSELPDTENTELTDTQIAPHDKIVVSLRVCDIALLYPIGLGLAWFAAISAAIPIFHLKPREILIRMS